MSNMIEVQNLKKYYGEVKAVDGVSFAVERGSLFAFLGVNGTGKSTTIHILCTLLEKTGGAVMVDEFDLDSDAARIRKSIGIVFQNNVLDNLLTVGENLTIRGQLQQLSGKALASRLSELRGLLMLDDIWKRPYGKLSGGQKRRCEIARALIGNPRLLILDEPTTGLDPQTRQVIWNLIRSLQKERGMTVFLTTHYMEEAALADSIVILERGKICAQGTPENLKAAHGKDILKLCFGDMVAGERQLRGMGLVPRRAADVWRVTVPSSHAALGILNALTDMTDFELIHGTMDDVFLQVTKQNGGAVT